MKNSDPDREAMKSLLLHRVIGFTNIFICLSLVLDTFGFKPGYSLQIYDHSFSERTTSRRSSYNTYFINTKSNIKLQVPDDFPGTLNPGDTFALYKSALYKQPLKIEYNVEGQNYQTEIGLLNSNLLGKLGMIFILIFSFLNVFGYRIIVNPNMNERFLFMSSVILIVATFFYFYS